MKKFIVLIPFLLLLIACRQKKTSLKDGQELEVSDFIEFFPKAELPFRVADTNLLKKENDSMRIGNTVFAQFIPDSILKHDFGKTSKPLLYPLGRVTEKNKETYLFIKAVLGKKRVGYLACFNTESKFLSAIPLVRTGFDNSTNSFGFVDKKFQITTYREIKKANKETGYKKNVYFYNNSANNFMLISTEPNEDIIENVINPIDTLAKKNKFSGDYIINKRNFISIRDGKDNSNIMFFVHFEKDNATCNGELKGAARFISATVAQYKENDSPCTIQFDFKGNVVTMKEMEGCGSYRDIKCFFDGKYTRKKETKSPATKKSS
ncbi:MAG TPA: hypothetical protein VK625_11665 [Flavitalea sp.]|nr:hypothetical protein [Flavitalea sp.]